MTSWVYVTCVLLTYGFIKEFRPSVPYINQYLLSLNESNFTDPILAGQVYPVWTYSYLAMLIPIFLFTDVLKYKPIITSEALSLAVVWALFLWGRTVLHMQIMQAFFGWATAAEIAYYSCIYSIVEEGFYQKLTSFVRGAVFAGRFVGYGLGHVLVAVQGEDESSLKLLNYVSFGAVFAAVIISLFICGIKLKPEEEKRQVFGEYIRTLIKNLQNAYKQLFVLKWSIWWAVSTCFVLQVGNYIQNLWSTIAIVESQPYNGLVEAINTLLSTAAALLVQFIRLNWPLIGELTLGFISIVQALCLIILWLTLSLPLAYVLYIIYCILYQALITIATYVVASRLEESSHGLIFGFNTFIAVVLQTIITILFVDHRGLALDIRVQFMVYGVLQGAMAVVFIIMGIVTVIRNWPLTLAKLRVVEEKNRRTVDSKDLKNDEHVLETLPSKSNEQN